jgi:hypothetical protein
MNPTEPTVSEECRALWAEWHELAARYPTPTLDDARADYLWIHEHAGDGSIDPEGKYWGLHIAIFQQKVVGAGPDPIRLQIQMSRKLNIHPARAITTYLGEI